MTLVHQNTPVLRSAFERFDHLLTEAKVNHSFSTDLEEQELSISWHTNGATRYLTADFEDNEALLFDSASELKTRKLNASSSFEDLIA